MGLGQVLGWFGWVGVGGVGVSVFPLWYWTRAFGPMYGGGLPGRVHAVQVVFIDQLVVLIVAVAHLVWLTLEPEVPEVLPKTWWEWSW